MEVRGDELVGGVAEEPVFGEPREGEVLVPEDEAGDGGSHGKVPREVLQEETDGKTVVAHEKLELRQGGERDLWVASGGLNGEFGEEGPRAGRNPSELVVTMGAEVGGRVGDAEGADAADVREEADEDVSGHQAFRVGQVELDRLG